MSRVNDREGSGLAPAALLVATAAPLRAALARALANHCALVEIAADARAGEALRRRFRFDFLLVEIRGIDDPVLAWIDEVQAVDASVALIGVSSEPTVAMVLAALRAGVTDFLATPFADHELQGAIRRTRIRRPGGPAIVQAAATAAEIAAARIPVDWTLAEVERWHSLSALAEAGGNKSRAARGLGISRKTLERKLKTWAAAAPASEVADGAPRRG